MRILRLFLLPLVLGTFGAGCDVVNCPPEVPYDGIDQDCSGTDLVDVDADGYNGGLSGNDCDDDVGTVNPGATEDCDGVDQNCDGEIDEDVTSTYYRDADGDGFGTEDETIQACVPGGDFVEEGDDCDDNDPNIGPDAEEICDGLDNDCNSVTDDDVTTIYYVDFDNDGYGNPTLMQGACGPPSGYVADATDCDDSDPAYRPGASEVDCADPNDYNCDGSVGYADNDGDGYPACLDCDDDGAQINPDAEDIADNAVDENCDGSDQTSGPDGDNDGYTTPDGDCDDTNATVHPNATEVPYDGIDQDCSGVDLNDVDGDGSPGGPSGNDCDDDDGTVNPGAMETCNGSDDDCADGVPSDETRDLDSDGSVACLDCEDAEAAIYPGAAETCDGGDTDCDAATFAPNENIDGDTDGSPLCLDCNDNSANVSPVDPEVCNAIDDDCDTDTDEGFDGDADGVTTCGADGDALAVGDNDCDDTDADVSPIDSEICNASDDDCEGGVDEGFDVDADTVTSCGPDGDASDVADNDCDDNDVNRFPGNPEVEGDGIDQDCSGTDTVDCYEDGDGDGIGGEYVPSADGDCTDVGESTESGDCDDEDENTSPNLPETCGDGDENCDNNVNAYDYGAFPGSPIGPDENTLTDSVVTSAAPGVVADVNVDISISHTWNSDLNVYLSAPDGTTVELFSGIGGSGAGVSVTLDDEATATLPVSSTTVVGTFRPEGSLADFSGVSAAGDWTLTVIDTADGDGGTLASWTLYFSTTATTDSDADGSCTDVDCDDGDLQTYPGAPELCDGIDTDCDNATFATGEDMDSDSDLSPDCVDCDDTDPDISELDLELCDDLADNDCDVFADCDDSDCDLDPACAPNVNRIFVATGGHQGNFGGLLGGDAICQTKADSQLLGGTWMAWLSDGLDGPITRFFPSPDPYELINGTRVADNWDDLVDGNIQNPLNIYEDGSPVGAIPYWTGTDRYGSPSANNCNGWTSTSGDGDNGYSVVTAEGWTEGTTICANTPLILCFEQ